MVALSPIHTCNPVKPCEAGFIVLFLLSVLKENIGGCMHRGKKKNLLHNKLGLLFKLQDDEGACSDG